MAKIKTTFIVCGHCSTKFRCPFYVADTKAFAQAIMWGNRVECPLCEVTIDCDERNMSYTLEPRMPSGGSRTPPVAGSTVNEDWAPV